MNRLTTRNSEGIGVLKQPFECERCGNLQWSLPDLGNGGLIDRLAEYEDIGLTPEQIREIDRLYAEKCKELAECNKSYLTGLELANITVALKKLREYEDMEKKSKLIKLPCAVGDTVYRVSPNCIYIDPCQITGFAKCDSVKSICYTVYIDPDEEDIILLSDFGKTVFLTSEEAEAALEKRKRETV